MPKARHLVELRPEDHPRRARTPIFAYGIGYLGAIARRSSKTVLRAQRVIDLGDPVQAVAWALSRTRPDLADAVLVEFGLAPRYVKPQQASQRSL